MFPFLSSSFYLTFSFSTKFYLWSENEESDEGIVCIHCMCKRVRAFFLALNKTITKRTLIAEVKGFILFFFWSIQVDKCFQLTYHVISKSCLFSFKENIYFCFVKVYCKVLTNTTAVTMKTSTIINLRAETKRQKELYNSW